MFATANANAQPYSPSVKARPRQKSPSAWSYPNPTVKTHVGRVLAKIGARDRIQAVILTNDLGLTHPTGTG
jgi:hypothetical protein